MLHTLLITIFWLSFAGVVYAYAGYPLSLFVLARWFGRRRPAPAIPDQALPSVTLLVAAYNEADVIEARIKNAMAFDYPRERLEILIATDGCDDGTNEIVARYADQGVRLAAFFPRRGKSSVLNDAVPRAHGEILVFSDANTMMASDAIRRLVRWFVDPEVGSVTGKLNLVDAETGRNADGLYWQYENFLKRAEARLEAVLGANGAIYALRRRLYSPIPGDTMIDDLTIPLLAKMRSGCRILYDAEAVAHEETAPDVAAEFKRRARIGAGGFQALSRLWPLLHPRFGWTAFAFLFHKVLRWVVPFLLLIMLASSAWLAVTRPAYAIVLSLQLLFYATAWAASGRPLTGVVGRGLRLMEMFTAMNLALLVGFGRWLRKPGSGAWVRTPRTA
ncbi:MAG: glycosyltransferase family 2 protein [Pirellulales bacterium]